MVTDLLASCVVGRNSGTESVCCTVYSMNELVDILGNDCVPFYRKRPFMRFLLWVYMNSGRERAARDAQRIAQNK